MDRASLARDATNSKRMGSDVKLPSKAYYALTILTALNAINLWHRYLIPNLSAVSVEHCDEECDDVPFVPLCYYDQETEQSELDCLACHESYNTAFYNMKDGACIDVSQYGILVGVGFTLIFGLATLCAGPLTDKFDRRFLHTGAILVWSLATAAHGTCKSFKCLLVARIFVGIGEAFNAPACYALITLYFPHSRRATANGIYSTGTYLGSAVSSLSLTLAGVIGWRTTAFISGACGVLVGALLFFTVEHNPAPQPESTVPEYSPIPNSDATTGMNATSKEMVKMAPDEMSLAERTAGRGGVTYSSLASASITREAAGGGPGGALGEGTGSYPTGSDVAGGLSHTKGGRAPLEGKEFSSTVSPSSFSFSGPENTGRNPFAASHSPTAAGTPLSYQQQRQPAGYERPLLAVTRSYDEAAEVAPHFLSDGEDVEVCSWCPPAAKRRIGGTLEVTRTGRLEVDGRRGSSSGDAHGSNSYGWFDESGGGTTSDSDDGYYYDDGGGVDVEYKHGAAAKAKKHDLVQALRTIVKNRIVLALFAASSVRMIATWSMASYMAIYYKRAFPDQQELFSVLNAFFVSSGGMASSYLGGAISDRLRVRDEGVLGYLPALGSAAAILPMAVVLFWPRFSVSISALFITYLVGECWLGPGMAILQKELPPELAGTSVAILLFLNSVVMNIGPTFISWDDPGTDSVRKPYFATVFLSLVLSFFLFSIVGYMVSHKGRRQRRVMSAVEAARLYEYNSVDRNFDGGNHGSAVRSNGSGKSVNYYTLAESTGPNGGRSKGRGPVVGGGENNHIRNTGYRQGSSVSMFEVVRRTFSGTGVKSPDGGHESSYSDDLALPGVEASTTASTVRKKAAARWGLAADSRLKRNGKSKGGARGAACGVEGEREALLVKGWTSGMGDNGRV